MRLAVVGLGLCSSAGTRVREHPFLIRAGVVPRWPSPFVDDGGEAVDVRYCPWIGAHAGYADRVARLCTSAQQEALMAFGQRDLALHLQLCFDDRAPWSDEERKRLEQRLMRSARAATLTRFAGAGAFAAALKASATQLGGGSEACLLVAADSLVTATAAAQCAALRTADWARPGPPLGEAAAAILVLSPQTAADQGLSVLGSIESASVARGAANDDNQEVVDGHGLTTALRQLAPPEPIRAVYGQLLVDPLREREWLIASARMAASFDPCHDSLCLEAEIGCLGSAAGAASLVYGLAAARHQTTTRADVAQGPFLAWAVSRDGVRGACLARCDPGPHGR
jgi:hypothetical protein